MGVRIVNDWGSVLIDDTYQNFAFAYKVAFQTAFLGGDDVADFYPAYMRLGCGYRLHVQDAAVGAPLVAVSAPSIVAVVEGYREGDGTTFLIKSRDPVSATAYVFGQPSVIGGNGNLKLYNAAGMKTFDSALKYARVVDFVQCLPPDHRQTPPPSEGDMNWRMPWAATRSYAGGVYACVQVTSERFWDMDGRSHDWQYFVAERSVGCRVNGPLIVFDYVFTRTGVASGVADYDAYGGLEATFIVLDVSGY